MAELLYPTRRRCKKCGKGLGLRHGDPVYQGLFCTPGCAQMAEPSAQAETAPRECRTQRDGAWVFKRRYRSEAEIPDRLRAEVTANWYWCNHCGHLHIGHTRMGENEQFRMFNDLSSDLPDLLVKLRGQASRRDVAAVAGVRAIRIKELETGVGHPEGLAALSRLLKVYGVRLGVATRKG